MTVIQHVSKPCSINRRRVLKLVVAGGAGTLLGTVGTHAAPTPTHRWRGKALGAEAEISFVGLKAGASQDMLDAVKSRLEKSDKSFSLYRPDSELSRLNKLGELRSPSAAFSDLLALSHRVYDLTNGAFDPTIQPLWRLYADHYAQDSEPATSTPDQDKIARALSLVGFRHVSQSADCASLKRQGASLSLNGIAQGYITDQISDILLQHGIKNALVNVGEYRALSGHSTKPKAWPVAIRNPRPGQAIYEMTKLQNRAISTSGGYGSRFGADGTAHHLFDPTTGTSTNRYASVTVWHRSAAMADALSTAFSAMPLNAIKMVTGKLGNTNVLLIDANGSTTRL